MMMYQLLFLFSHISFTHGISPAPPLYIPFLRYKGCLVSGDTEPYFIYREQSWRRLHFDQFHRLEGYKYQGERKGTETIMKDIKKTTTKQANKKKYKRGRGKEEEGI